MLDQTIANIQALDEDAIKAAQARQNILTKPTGALGMLEDLSIQLAGIQRKPLPSLSHPIIVVMAGDHGVTRSGVSAYPAEVTPQMVMNMLFGGAAINVLAKQIGAKTVIVDMGVASDIPDHPDLVTKKIAAGTGDITSEVAMSVEQAKAAIEAGIDVVNAQDADSFDILITGEMGIGNTTPAAAICAAITGRTPADIVGRGTGVDDEGLERKKAAVTQALNLHQPNAEEAIDILSKVGGFEIGGLVGAILATAAQGKPILVDGFISTSAAMLATLLNENVRSYLIGGHRSQELGHKIMLDWLQINPLVDLNLRLGEGSGAALAYPIVQASCKILSDMATFEDAGVSNKD